MTDMKVGDMFICNKKCGDLAVGTPYEIIENLGGSIAVRQAIIDYIPIEVFKERFEFLASPRNNKKDIRPLLKKGDKVRCITSMQEEHVLLRAGRVFELREDENPDRSTYVLTLHDMRWFVDKNIFEKYEEEPRVLKKGDKVKCIESVRGLFFSVAKGRIYKLALDENDGENKYNILGIALDSDNTQWLFSKSNFEPYVEEYCVVVHESLHSMCFQARCTLIVLSRCGASTTTTNFIGNGSNIKARPDKCAGCGKNLKYNS